MPACGDLAWRSYFMLDSSGGIFDFDVQATWDGLLTYLKRSAEYLSGASIGAFLLSVLADKRGSVHATQQLCMRSTSAFKIVCFCAFTDDLQSLFRVRPRSLHPNLFFFTGPMNFRPVVPSLLKTCCPKASCIVNIYQFLTIQLRLRRPVVRTFRSRFLVPCVESLL